MSFLIEFLLVILYEVFAQMLFELGVHSVAEPFQKKPSPILAFIGYIILGAISGFLSIFLFKNSFIHDTTLQVLNLIITPLVVGFLMSLLGKARAKKGLELIRLDKFSYGFAFAFSMAFVRYLHNS